MSNVHFSDQIGPGHQITWKELGDKMADSANGSRLDGHNDTLHGWSRDDRNGQMASQSVAHSGNLSSCWPLHTAMHRIICAKT